MNKAEERMKQIEEEYRKTHNIFCPFCGEELSEEEKGDFATCYGEDENQECTCENCYKTYWVKEIVDRTWKTSKGEEF